MSEVFVLINSRVHLHCSVLETNLESFLSAFFSVAGHCKAVRPLGFGCGFSRFGKGKGSFSKPWKNFDRGWNSLEAPA
jgi:hypothetical protein